MGPSSSEDQIDEVEAGWLLNGFGRIGVIVAAGLAVLIVVTITVVMGMA